MNSSEITFLLLHRNCMGILSKEIVCLETLKWIIRVSFAVTCLGVSHITKSMSQVNICQRYYREFNILSYHKITRIILLKLKKTPKPKLVICTVTYEYLSSSILFSLIASAMQKMVVSWGKTLVSRCVLLYFFLSIWKFFGEKSGPMTQICSLRTLCERIW